MTDFDLRKITGREPPVETPDEYMDAWAEALGDAAALRTECEALRARVAGYEADIETKVRLIQDLCAMQKEHEDRILAQGARVAEAVRMIEGYKRAGWLTNPAAAEQATDFINRASGNKSLQRIEGE